MRPRIRSFADDDMDAVVRLSLRAWVATRTALAGRRQGDAPQSEIRTAGWFATMRVSPVPFVFMV